MATYLDGSGKIWMALSGFDWIWLDLVQIRVWISKSVMEGFIGIIKGFSLI